MKPRQTLLYVTVVLLMIGSLWVLAGCQQPQRGDTTPTIEITPSPPAITPTPTITPLPLAVRVNDSGILLSEYEAELGRLKAVVGDGEQSLSDADLRQVVIQDFIEQLLLAQAAEKAGYRVDDSVLQARLDRLAEQMGGVELLQSWQSSQGYDEDSFRAALRRALAAEWQRNQIIGQVPETAEQIHVRQILVLDADLAEKIHTRLEAGAEFATLARQYDPATGGDLGWFPKGYLILAEIEQAAFSLETGQYSQVIPSAYGFHIVQVMERDPGRLLASEVRRTLQHKAMVTWLEDQKADSLIEILVH